MRAFPQNQRQPRQKPSARLTRSNSCPTAANQSANPLLYLQHTIGNQATLRLLQARANRSGAASDNEAGATTEVHSETPTTTRFAHDFSRIPVHSPAPLSFRSKLAVNTPGDIYEQEADHIAEQVMRMREPKLQRACACGGGCASCQTKSSSQEHQHLQTKHVSSNDSGQNIAPPIVHEVLASPGQPLDTSTRAFFEPRFGHDFSRVRIHTTAAAQQSARDVSANAYTVGHNLVFSANAFTSATQEGRRLIAHELAHVLQQSPPQRSQTYGQLESEALGFRKISAAPMYLQRYPLPSGPPPPKADWLRGVDATRLYGNLYIINLGNEGSVVVGPYKELDTYRIQNNLTFQSHHIVGEEFIDMVQTGFTKDTMPSVGLRPGAHEPISTSVTAQITTAYAGRQGGRVQLTATEILHIYNDAYTSWTPFVKLYQIARNILGAPKAPGKPPAGSTQVPPTTTGGTPATTTTVGTRVTAGAALVILGASYTFNWIIDSANEREMKAEIARQQPAMLKEQQDDPTLGFLLVFLFSGGSDSGEGATASAGFRELRWRRGYTEQEAKAKWNSEARIEGDSTYSYRFGWIAPVKAPSPLVVATPFQKVALAKFADISAIEFQRVEFKEWGGFDSYGTDGPLDATKWSEKAEAFRFIVLRMPAQVNYRNVADQPDKKAVAIEDQTVIGGVVPALMLDGDDPAITVWPADDATRELFARTHQVSDTEHKLLPLTNINLVRWLVPSQVKLLAKL